MKILNLDPENYSASAENILMSIGEYRAAVMTREDLLIEIEDVDIVILRFSHEIDEEILKSAINLKLIVTNATGTDHIDVTLCNNLGIDIISLQGDYEFLDHIYASSEHTWALLMSLLRHLPAAYMHVLKGGWDRNLFQGSELNGMSLGVLGYGRNGKLVSKYAQAFGMRVFVFDNKKIEAPAYVEVCSSIDELLASCHVLSIHLPLNIKTKKLINSEKMQKMNRGACIVNTSRGEIIDEDDLLQMLINGHISGAALDVLSGELNKESLRDNSLIKYAEEYDNLILTPHIGGVTKQSWEKTEVHVANKVVQWAAQKII